MKKDKVLEKRLKRFGKQIDKHRKDSTKINHKMSLVFGVLALGVSILVGFEYYCFNDVPAAMVGVVGVLLFACSGIIIHFLEEILIIRTLEDKLLVRVIGDLYGENEDEETGK